MSKYSLIYLIVLTTTLSFAQQKGYYSNLETTLQTPEKVIKLDSSNNNLYVTNNKSTALPASFKDLTKLKTLLLCNNDFSVFPKVVENLTELTWFSIANNNLTVFPKELKNLKEA